MNYITVKQLSDRLGVTPRYIQTLCRDGRLPGAVRFGKVWMLPEDTERPADRRCEAEEPVSKTALTPDEACWSVPGAVYFAPGTAEETLRALSHEPEAAALFKAQLAYLRGDIEASAELSNKLLLTSSDFEIKIGSAFLTGICAMYCGNVKGWLDARASIEELPCPRDGYTARKELWLAVYGASIYDVSAYPEWFRRGCFDSLPRGYYPAANLHYIKYIYLVGDSVVKKQPFSAEKFNKQLFVLPAICEPLISQTAAEKAVIPEIYLRLICASSYHHAGEDGHAIEHIDRALALALPDRILAPFAEQRLNLDSLVDDRMKQLDANALNEMRALHNRLMSGWTLLHNSLMNRSHTNVLTVKELEAARLAVFGLTNSEIAERMSISVNSVKSYLQIAKDKTGVKKRSELAKYI